jgi:hypothetical protein
LSGDSTMAINFETRQRIIAQALQELDFARTYKQGKTKNWRTNEDLYYSRKVNTEMARANVDLGQMSSFVHTLLSKIDNPLVFKFIKRKESQLKRVKLLNALRTIDQDKNDWDIKDITGKKQALIYGRAIYSYTADSINGYKANLDNVDVYDYLIDPSAGGIDIEKAFYMGRYGVVKTKSDLKKGVKDGIYLRTETTRLIEGSGNITEMNQEDVNKQNRTWDTNVWTQQKEIANPDKYKFWEWYTTFEGTRYYLLMTESGGTAIRVEPLKELFESNMFPFWTWAAFPDLTEFWTPSYCDYVREIFMAQAISINQMLDNAEQVNKPQKLVNVMAVPNLAELKYRRDGYIKVNKDIDLNKAVQQLTVPSINTPIEVYNILDGIQEKTSGVTAGAKGVSDEDKVGIYEGNQANAADRFGFLNKSYSFGYKRFAKLYELGVREHLIKKVAVDILGPDGVEIVEVSRRDIFRKDDEFGTMVESSNAETALSETEKRTKIAFLNAQAANPIQNPQKAYELQASIAGFEEDTIKQLLDTTDYGSAELMSEAERDIEALLDGEKIAPNQAANTAYKQRFVDYMKDNMEDITPDQFELLANYVLSLDEIIMQNTVRQANDILFKQQMEMITQGQQGMEQSQGAPGQQSPMVMDENKTEDIINTNGEVSPQL